MLRSPIAQLVLLSGNRSLARPGSTARCPRGRAVARTAASGGPVEQLGGGPSVDHALDRHAALDRPLAAVALPVELPRGVRIGVDGEVAADLDGQAQQPLRW